MISFESSSGYFSLKCGERLRIERAEVILKFGLCRIRKGGISSITPEPGLLCASVSLSLETSKQKAKMTKFPANAPLMPTLSCLRNRKQWIIIKGKLRKDGTMSICEAQDFAIYNFTLENISLRYEKKSR